MAGTRGALTKKKKPIVRVTQKAKEQFKALKAAHGEPTWTDKEATQLEMMYAFQWYNTTYGVKEAKAYIINYLKNTNRLVELKRFSNVPDKWVATTAGWMARMRSIGCKFPEREWAFFEERLTNMLGRDYDRVGSLTNDDVDEIKPLAQAQTKQARKKDEPWVEVISHIEEQLDIFYTAGYKSNFTVAEYLKRIEATPAVAKAVFDFYDPQLTEIEHAYNKTDLEIYEGYERYKPENLEKLYDFVLAIIDDAEAHSIVEKKPRKPRAIKPISIEKKMANFKCQLEFADLNLKSVPAEKILGAGELWAFSTKYNQLSVFRMKDGNGLDINRTAIANYDPALSKTKKLRARDVPTVIQQILTGGKIVLRNIMTEARGSDQKLQERMNENTILLRVVPK